VSKNIVSKKLSAILESRGMTQKDLAELTGVSRSTISNLIAGKFCSPHLVRSIAASLNVEYESLSPGENNLAYENLDILLFRDSIDIVAQILDKMNIQVAHYNDVVKLALELYKWHQGGDADIRKQTKEAHAYAEGIINYQLSLGLLKRKNQEA
jgi:putative transcriptional regulator